MWVLYCGKGGDVLLEFVVSVGVSLVLLLSDAVELWLGFLSWWVLVAFVFACVDWCCKLSVISV